MEKQQLEGYVKQAKDGDHEAFEKLYKATYADALYVVKVVLRGYSQQDWEDVLQEVYCAVLVNLHTYEENTHFKAWLRQIAKNKAVNYINKHGKRRIQEMELIIDMLADSDAAPHVLYKQEETADILKEHLEKLSPQQRRAITLHYFEDMRIKDVAAKMGVSESAVNTHLSRGRENLEASLLAQGGKQEVFYSVAILPLLVSMLNKDIATGLFTVPQNIIQAAISSSVGAAAGAGATATGTTTATGTGVATGTATATATAAPQQATILAYTEVAEATTATATTTTATTTAATTTAAASGTAAAATTGGIATKFAALGVATKAAIIGTVAAVTVAGVAVPVYLHNENEKAVQAALVLQQEQEEQERLEEQARIADEAERVRLEEEARAAEEEAARIEAERLEAERVAAEQEQARQEAEESAAAEQAAAEAAEAAQATQEQEASVSGTEASQPDTEQPGDTPDPVAPGGDVVPEQGYRTVDEEMAIGNPYVGQPEPAGGCPNDTVSDAVWDTGIGAWRGIDNMGRPILVDPWGGVRWYN